MENPHRGSVLHREKCEVVLFSRASHGPVVQAGRGRFENSDGPGRAAAHEMWARNGPLALPMRRPTCFHGPGRAATHEMWSTA